MRAFAGFVVAWVISISVAFVGGCLDAIVLMHGRAGSLAQTVAMTLFVGTTAAAAAAITAALVILMIALPFYLISQRMGWVSRSYYASSGIAIAVVVCVGLLFAPLTLNPFAANGAYDVPILTVLAGGPLATVAFWWVAAPETALRRRNNETASSS